MSTLDNFPRPDVYTYDDISLTYKLKKKKKEKKKTNIGKMISIIQFFSVIDIETISKMYDKIHVILISNEYDHYYSILTDLYRYHNIEWHFFNTYGFDFLFTSMSSQIYNIYRTNLTPSYYYLFENKPCILIEPNPDMVLINSIKPLYTLTNYNAEISGVMYLPCFSQTAECNLVIDYNNMSHRCPDPYYMDKMNYYNKIIKPSNDRYIAGYVLRKSALYDNSQTYMDDVIDTYIDKVTFSMNSDSTHIF